MVAADFARLHALDRVLWATTGRTWRPLPAPTLRPCSRRQPMDAAGCISATLAREDQLYVVSLAVVPAFDRAAFPETALRERGASLAHVAAVLAHCTSVFATPRLGPVQGEAEPIQVDARQGRLTHTLESLAGPHHMERLRMAWRWRGALRRLAHTSFLICPPVPHGDGRRMRPACAPAEDS